MGSCKRQPKIHGIVPSNQSKDEDDTEAMFTLHYAQCTTYFTPSIVVKSSAIR